jgi:hypothetical protein
MFDKVIRDFPLRTPSQTELNTTETDTNFHY